MIRFETAKIQNSPTVRLKKVLFGDSSDMARSTKVRQGLHICSNGWSNVPTQPREGLHTGLARKHFGNTLYMNPLRGFDNRTGTRSLQICIP